MPDAACFPALQACGISKSFGGRIANEDVDFIARRGEIHAVLGENGAGKSTLISMLAGAYRPDAGDILVDGIKTRFRGPRDALKAGIGVVYQEFRLIENLSVAENVLLGSGQRPARAAQSRIGALAAGAGFALDPAAKVRDLGIGHRQQVEILKLLARDLNVLIFDEPTAVLGEAQVAELFAALAALKRQGKAIVIITHRLREVRAIADRLTVLREGRIKALDRRPDEYSDPQLTELMVGAHAPVPPRPAAHALGPPRLTLEDVHIPSGTGAGLRGVSLTLHGGEILGVAGIRGNGQKEVAELAAGLLAPARGQVERAAGAVAFIPEDRLGMGLCRRMTVAENLGLRCYRTAPLAHALHLRRRRLHGFADRLIGHYRIPAQRGWTVTRLSGGNLQRVVIARELERMAPVIVAAQPSRGLDIRSAAFVHQQLVEAAQAGAAVLVVSEDLDELMTLCDRITVLYEGAVAATVARAAFERQALGALMLGGGRRQGPIAA